MAIFNRCACKTFNSHRSKICKSCGKKLGKNFYIQYSVDGKRKTEQAGDSIGYAREALAKRKTDVKEGKFFGVEKTVHWHKFFDTYYLNYCEKNLSSFDKGRFKTARDYSGFNTLMTKITRAGIENYKKIIDNGKRSPATINRYMQVVKFAFNYAEQLDLIEKNPVRKLTMYKEQPKERRVLCADEEIKLLAECRNSRNQVMYHFAMIALYTGMRYSEIMNLKWSNVSFSERSIRIYKTKNNQPREIPVIDILLPVLDDLNLLTGDYEYLLSVPDTGEKIKSLRKAFEHSVSRSSIKRIVFHELRHTMVTRLAASGASIIEIQQISGHKTAKMVERYTHVGLKESRKTIERLGDYLDAVEN